MFKTVIALALSFSLLAAPAQSAPSNEEFKIGISQEFETLNPISFTMVASVYLYSLIGRSLVYIDANGKWSPQLAKSIPTVENKGAKIITVDGKKTVQATWEIIPQAKWSDGKAITCEDFQFSIQVASSPNVSVQSKETFTQVQKVEWDAKTPQKCVFTYDKARWDFNQLGLLFPLPKHLEASVFEQWKDKNQGYETNSNYTKNPTMAGLYNGPYVISELKLGSHITFTPNPHFYGKQPNIKKIVVKYIPNTGTLEANLRSGTIDAISSLGLSFDQALALEKKIAAEKLAYNMEFKPGLTYEHIDLNLEDPVLKDVRVRKALVYALNRKELSQALFESKQPAAIHHLAPLDPWYTADPKKITLYPYSKKDAMKLLDEAGWKMAADGYRYKDGQKLTLGFKTTAGNKIRETVQTFLLNQWKAVGVDVQIKNEPARVLFGESMKKRQFTMAMYAWQSAPEAAPGIQFHSNQIPTEKNGWSGQNTTSWNNKRVDEICEKIEGEFSLAKRKALAAELLKLYTDEVPVIPLFYRSDIAVNPKTLKNFRLTGSQYAETNAAETWTF